MPYVENDGAQIYYETHGTGPGGVAPESAEQAQAALTAADNAAVK